jgi:hypothetical protein
MPIITQPPEIINSAYRPIVFEFMYTGTEINPVINAVVQLYFKGDLVTTFRAKSTRQADSLLFPGLTEFYFCVDVSERLRDLLAPNVEKPSVFFFENCPLGPVDNTDSIGEFYLFVTYEQLDNNGLITPVVGYDDTTNSFSACNITRQEGENMYLSEFLETAPPFARLLTNSPKIIELCREDNRFVSFMGTVQNAYQINLYDSAGLIIGTATGLLPSVSLIPQIFTLNMGIENGLKCLLTLPPSPGYDLDNPNISYYTIDFGVFLFSTYIQTSEIFRYNLTNGCKCCEKRSFKLHWLNVLGGVDSYEFCSVKELTQKTKAVTAQRSKSWIKGSLTPNDITEANRFKTSVNSTFTYKITSKDLSNAAAAWLGEMLGSVKVYLELENNNFVPVIIQDGDQLEHRQTGKIKFEIRVQTGFNYYQQNI